MTPRRSTYAILLTALGAFFLASGWACIKAQGSRIPLMEIIFFRALAGFVILYPLARARTKSLKGRNRPLLLARCILGFFAMCAGFYAMTHLPLGDASMLLNTYPLFVALIAPLFLKERSSPTTFVLAAVAFVGIGFVLKPSAHIMESASLAALAAGVIVAFVTIIIRRLHVTDNTWVITTWFTGFVLIASAIPAFLDFVALTRIDFLLIAVTGITLTVAQVLMTKAYRFADAATVAPFSYLSVLYSYGFDMIFRGRIPDGWSIAGSALAIAAGVGLLLTHKKDAASAAAAT